MPHRKPGRIGGHPAGYVRVMGSEDKISNKIDELAGRGKEAAGKATDSPDLEA